MLFRSGLLLFTDGHCHSLDSAAAMRLAKQLCHYQPVTQDDLDAADAQSVQLLCRLLEQGILYAEDDSENTEDFD